MQAPRILITQDNEETLAYQLELFRKVTRGFEGDLVVEPFNLNDDYRELVQRIRAGEWYDWVVVDLLLEGEDARAATGIALIRELRNEGLFARYAPRGTVPRGVRCLAVVSQLFGDRNEVGESVARELTGLGVRRDLLVPRPSFRQLAERICEYLTGEDLLADGTTSA